MPTTAIDAPDRQARQITRTVRFRENAAGLWTRTRQVLEFSANEATIHGCGAPVMMLKPPPPDSMRSFPTQAAVVLPLLSAETEAVLVRTITPASLVALTEPAAILSAETALLRRRLVGTAFFANLPALTDTLFGIVRSTDSPEMLIRELRVGAGLSQRALAQRAGTSQPAIARYERGVATPSWETLQRLAAACGWRLGLDPEPLPDPGDIELAELLLGLSPIERLRALKRYARLREIATAKP